MSGERHAARGPFGLLRQLYEWTMAQAERPYALYILAAVSFAESSFFPIPPDVMLIPMVLAARDRAFLIAGVCTIASVAGGYFGYWIGAALFDSVGAQVLAFYGAQGEFETFQALYDEHGVWIVGGAGLTPFPYKVVTILSGAMAMDPAAFGITSVLSRGARFFALALLLWWFGPQIRAFIDKYFAWLSVLAFVLLIGGFAVLAFL